MADNFDRLSVFKDGKKVAFTAGNTAYRALVQTLKSDDVTVEMTMRLLLTVPLCQAKITTDSPVELV